MRNVLLIGDSIRLGYCGYVKDDLKDIANVFYPETNCMHTQHTLVSLRNWVGLVGDPAATDVVHWNNGHWDVAHWEKEDVSLNTPEQYAAMLERIWRKLRAWCPKAKIIFALTTPVNPNGDLGSNPRTNAEIEQYNSVARELMGKLGVRVNDLYSLAKKQASSLYIDHAHFNEEGYRLLANAVTKVVRESL